MVALRRAWAETIDGPDPDAVARLASELSQIRVPMPRFLLRLAGVPRDMDDESELCLRQILLTNLYTMIQPGLLLMSNGRAAAMPVPGAWRSALRGRGLPLRGVWSAIKLWQLALRGFARGLFRLFRTFREASAGALRHPPAEGYSVALDTPESFLRPMPRNPETVYLDWLAVADGSSELWVHFAGEPVASDGRLTVSSPLPAFPNVRSRLAFACWSARAVLAAALGLVAGRGELALLLHDLVLLAHARSVGSGAMARRYLAENSRWFIRPLFTRWAARQGRSESVLVFYSTNMDACIRLAPDPAAPTFLPGYQIMDWDSYWVWDDHQADLVAAWGHDRNRARIVGPIPLADNDAQLPDLPGWSVAVFDVAPFKPVRLALMGLVPAYYRDTISARFLDDIREAAATAGATLVLKQKRTRRNRGPARYEAAIERMLAAPHVVVLDPQTSAVRVAAACDATLSMPFSSPALIAAAAGKPAAFYDPTGRLIASDRQRHGLPVVFGPSELGQWLQSSGASTGASHR